MDQETYVPRHMEDVEIQEWLESLDSVLESSGPDVAREILERLRAHATVSGIDLPFTANTPYANTIPARLEPLFPGDQQLERRIKSLIRWNALAMVVRANKVEHNIGGHISTYASAATLYEVGFNHFFRARNESFEGDTVYFQGHAAPGIYARAFLEGRLSVEQLENFRRELKPGGGLSSYPHPWLMPDFWEYPTVSMGLSPLMAIYQARYNRYLENRGLKQATDAKVWAFLGDGETDEPESLGAITLASREKLDNLIFVINCNLQRLDGPVRGNGQIIQELESAFRGARWNVIKVLWGSEWDPILERDTEGLLVKRMGEMVDGEYQKLVVSSGEYVRQFFFGSDPRLLKLVEPLPDEALRRLRLGGHDPRKVYAAYKAAVEHKGGPTVILARTIKGYGLGEAGEGKNVTHQQKKLNEEELREFRIALWDSHGRRRDCQDSVLPAGGRERGNSLPARAAADFGRIRAAEKGTGGGAFRRAFGNVQGILRGQRWARSFHDDGVCGHAAKDAEGPRNREAGGADRARRSADVWHGVFVPDGGHLFERWAEVRTGGCEHAALLQGSAGRADSGRGNYGSGLDGVVYRGGFGVRDARNQHHSVFYLLFDVWIAADRGLHLGRGGYAHARVPAGRNFGTDHACRRRIAAPGRQQPRAGAAGAEPDGLRSRLRVRDRGDHRGRHPADVRQRRKHFLLHYGDERALRDATDAGGREGRHFEGHVQIRRRPTNKKAKLRAQLLGSGAILNEVLQAQEILEKNYGVAADVWSVTSYKCLYTDAIETERWNRLHPDETPRVPYVKKCLGDEQGVFVAASDYLKTLPSMISKWLPKRMAVLGTDGFGRSEGRTALREFFEVDSRFVVLATLHELAQDGLVGEATVQNAIKDLGINPEKANPVIS